MELSALEGIINFVKTNFSADRNSAVQFKNYKKLVEYLAGKKLSIDAFDAEYLLDKSPKLRTMSELVSKLDFSVIAYDENLISLLSIYEANYDKPEVYMDDDYEDTLVYANEYRNHDLDLTRLYLTEINHELLSRDQEVELAKRKDEGDTEAFQELVNHNLKLVVSIAKMYARPNFPLMDAVQEGNIGLLTAVERFDYTKGYKLSTYATWWIRQGITRAIADKSKNIRIPVHFYEMINKIKRAKKQYEVVHGVAPTTEELSKITHLPINKVEECIMLDIDVVSLDAPIRNDEDEDSTVIDFVSDPYCGRDLFLDDIISDEFLKTFESIPNLSDREKDVIKMRFGFGDEGIATLEEIGKKYKLTRERVRQIENKALKKLRRNENIKSFYK